MFSFPVDSFYHVYSPNGICIKVDVMYVAHITFACEFILMIM